jgi:hypothetical protein
VVVFSNGTDTLYPAPNMTFSYNPDSSYIVHDQVGNFFYFPASSTNYMSPSYYFVVQYSN